MRNVSRMRMLPVYKAFDDVSFSSRILKVFANTMSWRSGFLFKILFYFWFD